MGKILSIFNAYPGLVIGFSTMSEGNMRIRPSGSIEIDAEAKNNRERFLDGLGIDRRSAISPILEHSAKVLTVSDTDGGKTFKDVDALITDRSNVFLTLTIADCLPVFIYDPGKNVVALVHAGWRGLQSKIIGNVIAKMEGSYNSDAPSMIAGVGPHIGSCHYEIQDDVSVKFGEYPEAILGRDGHKFLDLGIIAKAQLTSLGLKAENIEINPACTFESTDKYFSFRRDKPKIIETMIAVFGMNR